MANVVHHNNPHHNLYNNHTNSYHSREKLNSTTASRLHSLDTESNPKIGWMFFLFFFFLVEEPNCDESTYKTKFIDALFCHLYVCIDLSYFCLAQWRNVHFPSIIYDKPQMFESFLCSHPMLSEERKKREKKKTVEPNPICEWVVFVE